MNDNQYQTITGYLASSAEWREYPEYSGRGMYGETTRGIVVNQLPSKYVKEIAWEMDHFWDDDYDDDDIEDMEEDYRDLENDHNIFNSIRTDNLGLDYIWY